MVLKHIDKVIYFYLNKCYILITRLRILLEDYDMKKKIDVILASYNGEKYIEEQIKSILNNFETVPNYNCRLIISDDASRDRTVEIIESISDDRISIVDKERKGGVRLNFNFLINYTNADYVFFSDQDDIWLPNKMNIFMRRFEENDKNEPLLLHSDLQVVDDKLNVMSVSMFASQNIYKEPSLGQLLVSNSVTGCVMAINRSLLYKVKRSKLPYSIMHDWYIALIAMCFGRIEFINQSTILYRQHGGNQVGSVNRKFKDLFSVGKIKKFIKKSKESILDTRMQALTFIDDFGIQLSESDKDFISKYIVSFNDSNFISRLKLFITGRVIKKGFFRNAIFFFFYVFK